MSVDYSDPIIQQLIALGRQHEGIRAVILTSSRTNGTADLLSDYDAELYVTDPTPFIQHDDWFEVFGPVLVMLKLPHDEHAGCSRLIHYQNGFRIDFQVAPVAVLQQVGKLATFPYGFDVGYEVLLDKDGITASLAPPTFRAFIPKPPSEDEFTFIINGFWWNSTYVTKSLWRNEVIAAASWLNGIRQDFLRRMLDWSVEVRHHWSWKTGICGKGLEKVLDPETQRELCVACGGGSIEELWQAFFATISLFRKTAVKVATNLGFEYPHDLDARVTAYHTTISKLDPKLDNREEFVKLLLRDR